jgi:hypothetical protein
MTKEEIVLFKDAVGTIQSGVDTLKKLIDTPKQQEPEGIGESNLKEHEDPRKKDPDNHPIHHKTDEEIVENRIAFCRGILDDDETTTIVGYCYNNNTHEMYGQVIIQTSFFKEMAKLYLDVHEQ